MNLDPDIQLVFRWFIGALLHQADQPPPRPAPLALRPRATNGWVMAPQLADRELKRIDHLSPGCVSAASER